MISQYVMGVDIGSTASKCVVLKDGQEIIGQGIISVGAGTSGPDRAMEEALKQAGITQEDISKIVATGYGRNSLKCADKQMSELSCHAKGASFIFPEVQTVIDIGGQDAKALKISPAGRMVNFVMNDKCAAGTGRFLDVMSRVLETDIGELAEVGSQSTKKIDISSTCTVFAESEVISQLANDVAICDIVAGIHRSVGNRVGGLVKRVGVTPQVVMTGGVAQNWGVREALEAELKVPIATTPLAQIVGALGAALYAVELEIENIKE